jgi:hypothetical protein
MQARKHAAAQADVDIWHEYTCHIPVIYPWSVKVALFELESCHMPMMCLLHAWFDVCQLFQFVFDCLKAQIINF